MFFTDGIFIRCPAVTDMVCSSLLTSMNMPQGCIVEIHQNLRADFVKTSSHDDGLLGFTGFHDLPTARIKLMT